MSTSVVFPLISRLVDVLGAALPDVIVADGDFVTQESGTFLMIGWDDPENDRATSATSSQSWASLGNRARDEEGTVSCLVIRTDGDGVREARTVVADVVAQVEDVLRDAPDLDGTVPGLRWISFADNRTELRQWLTEDGAVCMYQFDLAYKARI